MIKSQGQFYVLLYVFSLYSTEILLHFTMFLLIQISLQIFSSLFFSVYSVAGRKHDRETRKKWESPKKVSDVNTFIGLFGSGL